MCLVFGIVLCVCVSCVYMDGRWSTWVVRVGAPSKIFKPHSQLLILFSKPLRLLWILVCFIGCDSSFFLLCSLLSSIVVHYASC